MFGNKQQSIAPANVIVMGQDMSREQEQQNNPMIYPDIPQDPNFLWKTLDTSDLIQEIEMRLKGFYYDPTKKNWIKKTKAIMEDEGIDILVWQVIKPNFNEHIVISCLSQEDIYRFMRDIRDAFRYWVMVNHVKYNFSVSNFDTVRNEIDHTIFAFLMRTREGKDHNRISNNYNFMEKMGFARKEEEKKNLFR
jgi:hypothetical protein